MTLVKRTLKTGTAVLASIPVLAMLSYAQLAQAQTLSEPTIQTISEDKLERLEEDLSIRSSNSDSVFELEPVSIEDRVVDVELFSDPNPRQRLEVVNEAFDNPDNGRGVEVIEFSLPVN